MESRVETTLNMVRTTGDIASSVQAFMEQHGISEESIVARSGLTPAVVHRVLAGQEDCNVSTLLALLDGAHLEVLVVPEAASKAVGSLFEPAKPAVKTRVDIVLDKVRAQEAVTHTRIGMPPMKNEEHPIWSLAAKRLFAALDQPWEERPVTSYRPELLKQYRPNVDSLLPPGVAEELAALGEQRAAQEYFMPTLVMDKFVLEFSWASCRLERERMSLEEAKKILEEDAPGWRDEAVLVSNADAIKMVLRYGRKWPLSIDFIRNSHVQIMKDMLSTRHLGRTRTVHTQVGKSRYRPLRRVPDIDAMLALACAQSAEIRNPIEAAFFLWLHIAYLQVFIEGNKQASRVVANIPLVKARCAPIAFIDIDVHDYMMAMLGFYEFGDASIAADIFEWSYRRSSERYAGIWHLERP
ncbi:Fic family protein [Herbaspirillum sp. LeCh32-8]|uniref:Fic family protein n=1 Tax=Herbaspirillum sp. LeCh32-8 TaxID=2821356 RepID=UPI001AE44A5F|nr:Fic family protein [Herbaspirillum sp. LeCh32-8]MBP0597738.1 Fic family protein [Herbaspirillum sp. LeCh32-8]